MLNTFPELLTYGFFAPTILRLAVALAFFYSAYYVFVHRKDIARHSFPLVGQAGWLGGASAVLNAVVGGMLGVGYYTQIASLLGIAAAVKGFLFVRRYPDLLPFSRATYLLIIAILLSLLLSGAGLWAIDIRL